MADQVPSWVIAIVICVIVIVVLTALLLWFVLGRRRSAPDVDRRATQYYRLRPVAAAATSGVSPISPLPNAPLWRRGGNVYSDNQSRRGGKIARGDTWENNYRGHTEGEEGNSRAGGRARDSVFNFF